MSAPARVLIASAAADHVLDLRAAARRVLGPSCEFLEMEVAEGSTDPALDWGIEEPCVRPVGETTASDVGSLGDQPLGVDGKTWRAVVEAAGRNRVDVIVVGRERRRRLRRALSGSFVHDLVDRAPIPVLVVDPAFGAETDRRARPRRR